MWGRWNLFGSGLLLVVALLNPASAADSGHPRSPILIDDRADLLSAPAEERIVARLGPLATGGPPVLILTLPELAGEAGWDQPSLPPALVGRVGEEALVLLVAWRERRILLHGPETTWRTARTYRRIVRRIIGPAFQAQAFDRGVEDGLEAALRAGSEVTAFLPADAALAQNAITLRPLTARGTLARALLPGWLVLDQADRARPTGPG